MYETPSPTQIRVRIARRLAYAARHARVWRSGRFVQTYWWNKRPNFGDDITQWLLPKYGLVPMYQEPAFAQLAGVGSILANLPTTYDGAVWGSGMMRDEVRPLEQARVLAVRGHLTADALRLAHEMPMGDPGLLMGRHLRKPRARWRLGVVPHYTHEDHAEFAAFARSGGAQVKVIKVGRSAPVVSREIAACDAILTTSLHGLVIADAFGVPAIWTRLQPEKSIGEFKFRDYESVVTPGVSRYREFSPELTIDDAVRLASRADAGIVSAACDGLERALTRVPGVLGPLPRFPRDLRRALHR